MILAVQKIGFLILTWNSEKYIADCIHAIFDSNQSLFQNTIVIVDNGSQDQTLDRIKKEQTLYQGSSHRLDILVLDKNYGTTISRNQGIKRLFALEPDLAYICILDSDTQINEEALHTMIAVLEDRQVGIVGPRLHDANGNYQIAGKDFSTATEKFLKVLPLKKLRQLGEQMESMIPLEGNGYKAVGYLISACWMMRREVFEKVGELDEKIFYAPEDLEYCLRCWENGYQVVHCYDASILHYWQRLSRKKLISKHNLEQIRGLIHIFVKHHYICSTKRLWAKFRSSKLI